MVTTRPQPQKERLPLKVDLRKWAKRGRGERLGGEAWSETKRQKRKSIRGNGREERSRGKPGQPPMTILPPLLQSHTQEKIAPLTSSRQYLHSSLTESLQTIVFCSLDLFYASTHICRIGGQSKYSAKSIQPVAKQRERVGSRGQAGVTTVRLVPVFGNQGQSETIQLRKPDACAPGSKITPDHQTKPNTARR